MFELFLVAFTLIKERKEGIAMNEYDVIVVGGGQAGLAMGYYLRQTNRRFLILDSQKRTGDSWRQRYDTLVLFTPRRYSALPGLEFPGEQMQLPTKEETADYLEMYARHFDLPIQHQTTVLRVEKTAGGYTVETADEVLHTRSLVVATGPFQTPFIPVLGQQDSSDVFSLHTAFYRNETQLPPGPVLIVGGGNSGVQIAVELAASRPVYLSMGQDRTFLPAMIFGRSIFSYLYAFGLLESPGTSWLGKKWRAKPDPIFGYSKQVRELTKNGQLHVTQRTRSIQNRTATFDDGAKAEISAIIWATGFRSNYEWLQIPGVLAADGQPIHERGISPVQDLYFIGLPWQYSRGSALLGGVGNDAKYIVERMENR